MAFTVKNGNGVNQLFPTWVDPSYSISATLAPGSSPNDVVTLKGSATKVVRVKKVVLSLVGGATPGTVTASLKRESALPTGGTHTAPGIAVHDSADAPATAVAAQYTAAPTVGTLVSTIAVGALACDAAVTVDRLVFEFADEFQKPIVLNGTDDILAIALSATIPASSVFMYEVQWEEGSN